MTARDEFDAALREALLNRARSEFGHHSTHDLKTILMPAYYAMAYGIAALVEEREKESDGKEK